MEATLIVMKYFRHLIPVFFILTPQTLWAWGGRGHHVICHAASFLVKEKGLQKYLRARPQMMGHLCNIPDSYWRGLGSDANKLGAPTHFVDFEITGLKVQDIPLDFKALTEKYQGQPNKTDPSKKIISFASEFGSIWWRADQLYRLAIRSAKEFPEAKPPQNSKQEKDEKFPFNQLIAEMMTNLGLLGHFVGDVAQPFHTTVDYDGYQTGHGGIHGFYEEVVVSSLGEDLEAKVLERARKFQRVQPTFLKEDTVLKKMRALSVVSFEDIPKILKLDPILKKSSVKEDKGLKIRTAAERADIETVKLKFKPLVVENMARAAALLAELWDQAYVAVGRPPLAVYKSYYYPHTPAFVAPDYLVDTTAKAQ